MNKLTKQFIVLFLTFIVLAALLSQISLPWQAEKPQVIPLNQLVALIDEGKIASLNVTLDGKVKGKGVDGKMIETQTLGTDSLITTLINYGVTAEQLKKINIEAKITSGWSSALGLIIPILLPFLLLGGLLYLFYRQAQGLNSKTWQFGGNAGKQVNLQKKGSTEELPVKTTFKDVAGVKEAKEELMEVIEFLKNPKKFTDLGARIPRGVLLIGPPGCGKTLLAKAVAGEAEVPFFHISGSEFMEMFVGVGASRVRSLFQKAKRSAPCIIFIDELDSIGRRRGSGFGGAHDERDQTLNQILVEMDGFETDINVIVMAATNRPDVLDPALLRPGRFDRRVSLELPDIEERTEILQVHAKGKPLTKTVNLRRVAERTPGFSGADLANLMNEAAIFTAKKNKKQVGMEEILPSIEKVLLGPERRSRVITDKEKEITAYHEAGHAVVSYFLPNADPVHKISIVARGQAGGYTLKVPENDKHLHSRAEFFDELAVSMGGLAAERFKFNEITTGASADLQHATQLARKLVTKFGMSDKIGPIALEEDTNGFGGGLPWEESRPTLSNETLKQIDDEIAEVLKKAYNKAQVIITANQKKLDTVAQKLLEQEKIEKEEFESLMAADLNTPEIK
ncbi:MAG: cell division protein FtsH [Candidatus Jacksonbacteria bacterium RIFOXYC2_FULL_44_29]|nr:MAG: ATP-dependent zinc metalloprotease FtsH [Parcubacteria group bacterium GW2011_GWC2_44_22]OGY74955.1 MAG: cell division protein FtsH [Candidatus Jacksonbacteria bacterium RIFOXYA2_FULL_43_12]OGY76508.1 MAG: cell division protein FtsH [Candidatus Jacksonbacteria bacterium RIFOXYB2_FULL_44_15]OGY78488.1 MAG: cell division protein FtsH [Candidatus Jacksonbacteria bacterium RIFOXYC2_FULL_44_29]OGY81145.1 MAG: cell division protein FtsH [Candidatus Jacksonbacteria bacterium RIFOXYD2_FULL_43_2